MERTPLQAVIQRAYGAPKDVLALGEIPVPTIEDDEVLVRVHASSVHPDVWHVITGHPRVLRLMGSGVRAPKIRVPGTDLAGVVEAVGSGVTRFRPGDAVFGETIRGYQWKNGGAWAEVATAPESGWRACRRCRSRRPRPCRPRAHRPEPAAGTASVRAKVLVNGAAGGGEASRCSRESRWRGGDGGGSHRRWSWSARSAPIT